MVFIYWTNYNISHNARNLKLTPLYLERIFRFETNFSIWNIFFPSFMQYEVNFSCDQKLNRDIFDLNQILRAKRIFGAIWNEIRSLIFDLNRIFGTIWSEFLVRCETNFWYDRKRNHIWSDIFDLKRICSCDLKRSPSSEATFSCDMKWYTLSEANSAI